MPCTCEELWKRKIDSREELLLSRCGYRPLEGFDGRVYFWDEGQKGISSVAADGSDLRLELPYDPECRRSTHAWTVWEKNLVYVDCHDVRIYMLDLETHQASMLADVLESHRVDDLLSIDISPDGQWIIYSRIDRAGSDLMLVDPFQ